MAVAIDRIERLQRAARVADNDPLSLCYRDFDVPLRSFLTRRTRSASDAEDLAQEAFLRLLRMNDRNGIRSIKSFLFQTATNLARDRMRRSHTRMMRGAVSTNEIDLPDSGSEPSKNLESMQAVAAVTRVLNDLRPSTRQAFLLYRLEACSQAEIARQMGISVSMVEKHVGVAMAALQRASIGPG